MAAQEAMYTDALVCDDAMLHSRDFSRVTHDETKFFNAIQRAAIDAVEEARGALNQPAHPFRRLSTSFMSGSIPVGG